MDPGKIEAIRSWKSPTSKKELQTFLGFANIYRKFIKDFAKDSLVLTPLTGKKEWEWKEEQEQGFRNLIEKLCREPVLWTIKDEGKLKIEVDGSGFAMGAVLLQEQENQWRPLTHMSETYNSVLRPLQTRNIHIAYWSLQALGQGKHTRMSLLQQYSSPPPQTHRPLDDAKETLQFFALSNGPNVHG